MEVFSIIGDIFSLDNILNLSAQIIALASLITASTDTPNRSEGILSQIYRMIEYLALVTDKAKQKSNHF